MGRKSKGRISSQSSSNCSVREMMRGLKNRWGRFQCPRDGSICKSLEAWFWHRHKYHQTEHINYVELDPDEEDAPAATPQSTSPSSSYPHPPHPSSPRLLPPEAFAPRRQPEIVFRDDVSDLTDPDIPVLLLSEEVTSHEEAPPGGRPEVVRWEVMDESTSVGDDEEQNGGGSHHHVAMTTADSRSPLAESLGDAVAPRLHGNDPHGNQESRTMRDSRSKRSCSREKNAHHHSSDAHGNQYQRRDRSRSHERCSLERAVPPTHCPASSLPTAAPSRSSAMDLVAVYVLRLLRRDGRPRPVAKDILQEVESRFPGLGLSREGLEGVVTGALMGARDQWTNGYNAGWKDGAKEVLNAPILRSVPPSPLHSPGGVATPNNSCARNPGQVTLLTLGRRSQDEKEDKIVNVCRNSIESLATSAEETRGCSTLQHGNDPNNNDADIVTEN